MPLICGQNDGNILRSAQKEISNAQLTSLDEDTPISLRNYELSK